LCVAGDVDTWAANCQSRHRDTCVTGKEGRGVMIVVVLDVRKILTPDL
jgi:hypothetical protein